MTTTKALIVVSAAIVAVCVSNANAHPGGLNGEGCHNNRKTGDHHCHRGPKASSSPKASLREESQSTPVGNFNNSTSISAEEKSMTSESNGSPGRAFGSCAEARAAGAAPVRRGDPGYGSHLDRDGDGMGCEPYRKR